MLVFDMWGLVVGIGFEIFVALGFSLGADLRCDAVGDYFDGIEDGQQVVDKACAGNDVGDEIDGEDKIAEGADDDAFVAEGDGGVGEGIEEE